MLFISNALIPWRKKNKWFPLKLTYTHFSDLHFNITPTLRDPRDEHPILEEFSSGRLMQKKGYCSKAFFRIYFPSLLRGQISLPHTSSVEQLCTHSYGNSNINPLVGLHHQSIGLVCSPLQSCLFLAFCLLLCGNISIIFVVHGWILHRNFILVSYFGTWKADFYLSASKLLSIVAISLQFFW